MSRKLSPWCKAAKIKMIELDMSVQELADKLGYSREYTSSVVHGRVYSDIAIQAISDALNIKEIARSLE